MTPKGSGSKQNKHLLFQFLWIRNLGTAYLSGLVQGLSGGWIRDSGWGCSHLEVWVKLYILLQRCSSTWLESACWLSVAASAPHHMDLFIGLPEWPLERVIQRKARWKLLYLLYASLGSHTSFSQYPISYTGQPSSLWEETARRCK